MKKSARFYSIIWTVCFALFNVLVFWVPNAKIEEEKFAGTFWIGYIFISITFVGQLVCSVFSLSKKNTQKVFYGIPLIYYSYSGLIAMLFVGSLFMILPSVQKWIGIVICVCILSINIIATVKAMASYAIVSQIDKEVTKKTVLIKELSAQAQLLIASSGTPEMKELAKCAYEELTYSDPMSSDKLQEIDGQVEHHFSNFANAINENDFELAKDIFETLKSSIAQRNAMCKLNK